VAKSKTNKSLRKKENKKNNLIIIIINFIHINVYIFICARSRYAIEVRPKNNIVLAGENRKQIIIICKKLNHILFAIIY